MSKAARSAAAKRDWGSDETGTSIMHVDMDAFFAMCELVKRPELRGKPVIVGGGDRGVVLAATYEARAFGVRSAMPMARAMQACPAAIVVPPDGHTYARVSRSVMGMMAEITPIIEQVSIDEAFLDLSGARRLLGPPTQIGARLRARVQAEHGVTCSVGIAKNKFLAKLASTMAKPDGLLLVPVQASVPFLRTLPVGALWGVGAKTEEALAKWGITTVAQLADTDLATLQVAIGKATGAHLHNLAWGRDDRLVEVVHHEKSISNETTFIVDQYDREVVAGRILALCDKVAGRLREQGVSARTVTLKVRTGDFHTITRSRTLEQATDVARELYRVCQELFEAVNLRGLPVRLVGVGGAGLVLREGQAEQFTLEQAVQERPEQRRDAELALDAIRSRFGSRAIGLGAGGMKDSEWR
ncbi:MAG: DNA polymerase IV [Promicromonosporaceae bacterium]|nr:DNA polymerase IV [Promicromonosporaceae bacterium]